MTSKQLPIMIGFSAGVFVLAMMFYSRMDSKIMQMHELDMQRQVAFQEWADEICARGYSRAWIEGGEYKAECY